MHIVQNEEDGVLCCTFQGVTGQDTKLLLDAMVLGLEGIREQYSDKYLRLIFEEV